MQLPTGRNTTNQNLPPGQKPVATPSTPKSPNLVSPSSSVPYIVRRTEAIGVSSRRTGTGVIPNPTPTSLLDALCWISIESESGLGVSEDGRGGVRRMEAGSIADPSVAEFPPSGGIPKGRYASLCGRRATTRWGIGTGLGECGRAG